MKEMFHLVNNNDNFIDLNIYQYGHQTCKPAHSFGPAIRQHYLFHYVISGKGSLIIENSKKDNITYNITKNQGFLISPNQCCHYIADKDDPWEYIWVEFSGLKAEEYLKLSGLSYNNPIYISEKNDLTIKDILINIINSDESDPLQAIGYGYLFLYTLKNTSKYKMKETYGDLKKFYVKEAINYIENNFQRNITVEDISNFSGLNKSYFGKIFKDVMNITPQDFLIQYRMRKACELLKTTSLSIKEVGEQVGYSNQLHFSKIFKNTYKISPREWKLKNQFKK